MPFIQETIHKLEVAGGMKYVRYLLAALIAIMLIVFYNTRVARNFSTEEAMDAAQVARNLADGRGFTTSFVRPLSIHLVSQRNQQDRSGSLSDLAELKAHPDLANPPVYPAVLAGLMKVLPFKFEVSGGKSFWSNAGRFWRYQPDFLIEWFNQFLFFVVLALIYLWARRLFDPVIAGTSALLLFGSNLLWRFSASGLSTMLLLLIFTGVLWCLTLWQEEVAEPRRGPGFLWMLAVSIGVLIGLGGLTRYGFAWLIFPALAYVAISGAPRRGPLCAVLFLVFAAVMTSWLVRNYQVSGTLFGIPGFDIWQGASLFPGDQLERTLHPDVKFSMRALMLKLFINSRSLLENEFFTFGGGWLTALFLVGLLVSFRNVVIRRLRYFILASLAILFVVQALGRTRLSEDSPIVNSENYLVLLLPCVTVYGVSLFYLLLDQVRFPFEKLRLAAISAFLVLACLPLILSLLPPRNLPIVFPPYYPPAIRIAADDFREQELLMSDVPWAVAWYGRRECVWLTLSAFKDPKDPSDEENFFAINDLLKPISGIYLSPKMMDFRLQSDIVQPGPTSWGNLVVSTLFQKKVPAPFPLRELNLDYLREQQFLVSDWKRWNKPD